MVDTLRIASFDPASQRNLGWSFLKYNLKKQKAIVSADVFVMKDYPNPWQVYWPMFCIIDQFLSEVKPDLVIIEKTSSFSGGFISGQVSQCIGNILSVCGKYKLNVEFVYPSSVKLLVAGHGKATKTQIKKSVCKFILDLTGNNVVYTSEHAYDAVSNILYYLINAQTEFSWLTQKQEIARKKRVSQCLKKVKKTET